MPYYADMSPIYFPRYLCPRNKAVVLELLRYGLEEGPLHHPERYNRRFNFPPSRQILSPERMDQLIALTEPYKKPFLVECRDYVLEMIHRYLVHPFFHDSDDEY
ncbi:uncharacterized protein LOC119671481 [Teleopsis dalmanni]|uniref:uncharacterized protein LOC119671481 n=1 Tax=Teleopsis dalmanni TaxID=139649 RepID=UPI000D329494|nr:uncharacterized protein LOC119671481 [Teleopsis dalmanni]